MNDILEKFTNHLKAALTRALVHVVETGGEAISPSHLLWALGMQQGSIGAEIIAKSGLNQETLKKLVGERETLTPAHPSQAARATPLLSEEAKKAFEKAVLSASMHEHRYVGTEHLLYGILTTRTKEISQFLSSHSVNPDTLYDHLNTVFKTTTAFPDFPKPTLDMPKGLQPCEECGEVHDKHETDEKSALEYFATELTAKTRVEKINLLVGRDQEVDRLATILSRRTKNNPLLLGDPGVGKTAIVEGLAKRIVSGDVPAALKNRRIFQLDMGSLIAGTMYRGDFEARLQDVMDELKHLSNAILFIDEIHTIIGAGATSGSLDAANLLKPALARGELRCIGATTHQEFKKHIQTDPALERRFATIAVSEPTAEETRHILAGVAKQYAEHHGVKYSNEALDAMIEVAARHMPQKFFPDKAIDILDEAGAAAGMNVRQATSENSNNEKLEHDMQELSRLKEAKAQAVASERFTEAMELKAAEEELKKTIEQSKISARPASNVIVDPATVLKVASRLTGVPLEELSRDDATHLRGLPERLAARVVAQEAATQAVAQAVQRARLGIAQPNRPLASFLFVGPSGVGKTELAKALAEELFHDRKALVRLDMSEFAESYGVSKLIGSAPGYVGYREGAKLTDTIKHRPHAVILFDEFEKAHRDVHNLLLQILDEGMLTDATGQTVSFRNAIIIMTTNAGRDRFDGAELGFGSTNNRAPSVQSLRPKLEEHFSPELLNRVDHIAVFHRLTKSDIAAVAERELKELVTRLHKQGISLKADRAVASLVAEKVNPKLGARDVRRIVEEQIENLLVEALLKKKKASSLRLSIKDDRFDVKHKV